MSLRGVRPKTKKQENYRECRDEWFGIYHYAII